MDVRELAVSVLEIERDCAGGLTGAAADLSQAKLEALRKVDTHAVLGARYGVFNRFTLHGHDARDVDLRAARIHIDVELNWTKQGWMLGRAHRAEHPPYGGHILGILAR